MKAPPTAHLWSSPVVAQRQDVHAGAGHSDRGRRCDLPVASGPAVAHVAARSGCGCRSRGLASRRETWALTVGTLMCSSRAMSAFTAPAPTARATSRSRGVRLASRFARPFAARRLPLVACDQRCQPAGDPRREHPVARVDELDGAHDLGWWRVLEEEPSGPRAQRPRDVLVGVERREHDDPWRTGLCAQRVGRGDAVELGHPDVHQHDVRPVPVDGGEHPAAVRGLADHLDLLGTREDHAQSRDAEPETVGRAASEAGVVLTRLGPSGTAGLERLSFELTGDGADGAHSSEALGR